MLKNGYRVFYKEINKTNVGVNGENIKYSTAHVHEIVLIISLQTYKRSEIVALSVKLY